MPIKQIALFALNSPFINLSKCKASPKDVAIRQKLQIAAWDSLWPNQQGSAIGLSHAFGHVLGATYSIPHGITSCLTLDRTAALLATTLPPYEKACLARAADFIPRHFNFDGLSTSASISDASIFEDDSDEELTRKTLIVSKAFQQLVKELGLTSTLGEYGVPQGDFEKIAQEVASAIENTPGAPSGGKLLEEVLRKAT
ncbi:hypothetical protein FRB94_005216 [Tulasnella sp. JGI-2019a]|nr:hypothetical protein FRB93_013778 [Tulasnella sp. JGI-2019a]KAG9000709.1 hypothetical protein FRB94_005216 [Tulasnella sp. JGI-2019a]